MDRARKKERRQKKGKQWRWGKNGRERGLQRQKEIRRDREPEGTARPGTEGNVWWGVQVKELNSGSQRN